MSHPDNNDVGPLDTLKVDRTVISVGSILEESDEKAYWLSRTPGERLEALELYRQIAYGYDPNTLRLQRVLEIAEFPIK
jgi:hypothetical protein